MLTELPIITTSVGAILDAVTHNLSALIIKENDIDSITRSIKQIITYPEKYTMLGRNARTTALSTFTQEQMINNMEKIFTKTHIAYQN